MSVLFKNIAIEEAQLLLAKGATIVDIRDMSSYTAGHISEAMHLSDNNLTDFVQAHEFDKPLLVYCYHGNSSQPAAQYLAEQGFDHVYSLIGGYTAWCADTTKN